MHQDYKSSAAAKRHMHRWKLAVLILVGALLMQRNIGADDLPAILFFGGLPA